MSGFNPDDLSPREWGSASDRSLIRWIESLKQSDRSSYKMLAVEVWAIAKTMDELYPGFWNRFMTNRQLALRQFMENRQAQREGGEAKDFSGMPGAAIGFDPPSAASDLSLDPSAGG